MNCSEADMFRYWLILNGMIVSVGSYSHKEEGTTIYTKNAELGDDLRSIFPNSNVYESGMDEVKSEIELPGTVENANNADAYIVVGKNNTEVF